MIIFLLFSANVLIRHTHNHSNENIRKNKQTLIEGVQTSSYYLNSKRYDNNNIGQTILT